MAEYALIGDDKYGCVIVVYDRTCTTWRDDGEIHTTPFQDDPATGQQLRLEWTNGPELVAPTTAFAKASARSTARRLERKAASDA